MPTYGEKLEKLMEDNGFEVSESLKLRRSFISLYGELVEQIDQGSASPTVIRSREEYDFVKGCKNTNLNEYLNGKNRFAKEGLQIVVTSIEKDKVILTVVPI